MSKELPNGTPADTLRTRRLAIFSLACFGIALVLSLLYWSHGCGGSVGDMAAAGLALLQMGLIHLLGVIGGILGFVGRRSSTLARRGLWSNAIVLVAFWIWACSSRGAELPHH